MRSPGVIYRKYRQIKRKLLYYKISEYHKKAHQNCAYGHFVKYSDNDNRDRTSKLCMYSVWTDPKKEFDHRKIDVCTCAASCNAFAPKRSKESLAEDFEKEIQDYNTCLKKYPELAAYKWVLDKDLEEAKKNPGLINRFLISVIIFIENILKP